MTILDNKAIGNRLVSYRTKLRGNSKVVSARKFAMDAGIDPSQYVKIEKGELPITDNILNKLLNFYPEISKNFLLYGLGTSVPNPLKKSTENRNAKPDANEITLLNYKIKRVYVESFTSLY